MITARIQHYARCAECGEGIVKGDTAVQGDGYTAHADCAPDAGSYLVTAQAHEEAMERRSEAEDVDYWAPGDDY